MTMTVDLTKTPWVCMDCGTANAANGNCTRCQSGPLVDGRDAAVREGCREIDDRIRERHDYKLYAIAYGPVFIVATVIAVAISWIIAGVVFTLLAAVAAVVQRGLRRVFPAKVRFPYIAGM